MTTHTRAPKALLLFGVLFIAMSLVACGGGPSPAGPTVHSTPTPSLERSLSLRVTTLSGNGSSDSLVPVAGAQISVGNLTGTTNQSGAVTVTGVMSTTDTVRITKDGFLLRAAMQGKGGGAGIASDEYPLWAPVPDEAFVKELNYGVYTRERLAKPAGSINIVLDKSITDQGGNIVSIFERVAQLGTEANGEFPIAVGSGVVPITVKYDPNDPILLANPSYNAYFKADAFPVFRSGTVMFRYRMSESARESFFMYDALHEIGGHGTGLGHHSGDGLMGVLHSVAGFSDIELRNFRFRRLRMAGNAFPDDGTAVQSASSGPVVIGCER